MTHYYNEFDNFAADWLQELMDAGELPVGTIDRRSIKDVTADEIRQNEQVHFFAGIGGWQLALRLAGWPAGRSVWTGSCPCQPYSAAGKRKGNADDRHLWPEMFRLIRECRPDTIFGEQVEAAIRHGWLDDLSADLEGEGYAVGAVVLGAHSVHAPHIRQRLFWVADTQRGPSERQRFKLGETSGGMQGETREQRVRPDVWDGRDADRVAYTDGWKQGDGHLQRSGQHGQQPENGLAGVGLADTTQVGRSGRNGAGRKDRAETADCLRLGQSIESRLEGFSGDGDDRNKSRRINTPANGPAAATGHWDDIEWINCRDGKARPVMPGVRLLAHGFPNRVGLLRGFGNAIVPQVAAEFIMAFLQRGDDGC